MNLAVDIGNTLIKMAVVDKGQVVDTFKTERGEKGYIDSVFEAYPGINSAIMVCSGGESPEIERVLIEKLGGFMLFTNQIPVPIENLYATPKTLGCDRLAAAVGANALYPDSNVLIVDFGTAITIDFVNSQNQYLGGNISPGAGLRFRALHEYTNALPLLSFSDEVALIGDTTQSAIINGVINGVVFEVEGYISEFEKKYDDLRVIFTGGDGNFFAKRLKNPIFATYDLVVYGLNRILEYNAK